MKQGALALRQLPHETDVAHCAEMQPLTRRQQRGQTLVLVLIVIAVIAAGYWMLLSSRSFREQDAARFAREAAERLVFKMGAF